MKYNIALTRVILDLLWQRFPECVFGKTKKQHEKDSVQQARVRAELPLTRQEIKLCFIVCLVLIVKVTVIWPADEQTLNLMAEELHFSDSLI